MDRAKCLVLLCFALCVGLLRSQRHHGEACAIQDSEGGVRPHKVLIFIDAAYFNIFANWLVYYEELCGVHDSATNTTSVPDLEMVCMDRAVEQQLRQGLSCSPYSHNIKSFRTPKTTSPSPTTTMTAISSSSAKFRRKVSEVWISRMTIAIQILEAGLDVIMTDTDAFWLGNPYPSLSSLANTSHIISSRGTFPKEISKRWGSTLCMGFIYIRTDEFTINLFTLILELMSATRLPDDQYTINQLLHEMEIQWVAGETSLGTVVVDSQPFQIALLPETKFLRRCLNTTRMGDEVSNPSLSIREHVASRLSNAIVAHCLIAPSNGRRKQTYLQHYSLWRVAVSVEAPSRKDDEAKVREARAYKLRKNAARKSQPLISARRTTRPMNQSSALPSPAPAPTVHFMRKGERRPPSLRGSSSRPAPDRKMAHARSNSSLPTLPVQSAKSLPLMEEPPWRLSHIQQRNRTNAVYEQWKRKQLSKAARSKDSAVNRLDSLSSRENQKSERESQYPPSVKQNRGEQRAPNRESNDLESTSVNNEFEEKEDEEEDGTEEYSVREKRARTSWASIQVDGKRIFAVSPVKRRKRRIGFG